MSKILSFTYIDLEFNCHWADMAGTLGSHKTKTPKTNQAAGPSPTRRALNFMGNLILFMCDYKGKFNSRHQESTTPSYLRTSSLALHNYLNFSPLLLGEKNF